MTMEIFYELFEALPRQGPGSASATRQAWSMLNELHDLKRILDIGCGSGAATLELAQLSAGKVTGHHDPTSA